MNVASYWKADWRLNHEVNEACDLNCFLTCQAVQFLKSKYQFAKRGCILKSSVLRSIDWQLYSRSLVKCSAKKVYLTLEILTRDRKWFYVGIYFAIFSSVCFKKGYWKLEKGQRSLSYERLVRMLWRFQYHNLFKTKPVVCSLECSSIFDEIKYQNRKWM